MSLIPDSVIALNERVMIYDDNDDDDDDDQIQ